MSFAHHSFLALSFCLVFTTITKATGESIPGNEEHKTVEIRSSFPVFGSPNAPVHIEVFFHSLSERSKARLLRYVNLSENYPDDVMLMIRPVGRNPEKFNDFFAAHQHGQMKGFLSNSNTPYQHSTGSMTSLDSKSILEKCNERLLNLGHSLSSTTFFNGRNILIREESDYRLHKTFKEHLHRVRIALSQGVSKHLLPFHFNPTTFDFSTDHVVPRRFSGRQILQTMDSDITPMKLVPAPQRRNAVMAKIRSQSVHDTHIYCSIELSCLKMVSTIERDIQKLGVVSSIYVHFAQFDEVSNVERQTLDSWMRFFRCANSRGLSFESVTNALGTFTNKSPAELTLSSTMVGFTPQEMEACIKSHPQDFLIKTATQLAIDSNIKALPTVVIGDVAHAGRPSFETLKSLLYAERQDGLFSWLSKKLTTQSRKD